VGNLAHFQKVSIMTSAFTQALSLDQLRSSVPSAFAASAYAKTSPTYVFISTEELVHALMREGFRPMKGQQTRTRDAERGSFAKHMIRFRHELTNVTLEDAIPEIVLINSHDASSAYQLHAGLFRPVCTNGLLTHIGDFGLIRVPHRGNVLDHIVEGALEIASGFERVGEVVAQMAATKLDESARLAFAERAAQIRYTGEDARIPYSPSRLLEARRAVDSPPDLWRTYNVVQENLIRGGVLGRTANGRLSRTRSIRAIREDVRINTVLWQLAMTLIRA
jgi:hypothetical protein